jgi:hypothetical protein
MTTPKKRTAKKSPKPAPSYEPAWDSEKGPSDEQVETALRVLRADYWTSVRATAADIIARVKSGEIKRDDLYDAIHETCDGSYWVIYTHANQRAVLCSDHDWTEDAEEMGEPEKASDALRAFYCLKADVTAQVDAELPDEADSDEESEDVA